MRRLLVFLLILAAILLLPIVAAFPLHAETLCETLPATFSAGIRRTGPAMVETRVSTNAPAAFTRAVRGNTLLVALRLD